MIWLRQLRFLFRRTRHDSEMSVEMRHHLEEQIRLNMQTGMTPEAARHAAERTFGNASSVQELCREQRRWLWLEQIAQDIRFALRGLARTPGYASIAMLTLALGIGATTTIFSVIYGVLLDPYPYARSAEIRAPELRDSKTGRPAGLRMTDYVEMSRLPGVASAMATAYGNVVLSGGINPESITAPRLTGTAFEFLEVPPLFGRGLNPGDIRPDGETEPVVVLSFGLWKRLFNGDPGAVGRTLVLDDAPHTIVGVMPPRFGWYTHDGLWRPLSTRDLNLGIRPIVRLRPGVSKEVASAQLLTLLNEQAKREPGRFPKDGFNAWFNNYLDVTVASGRMRDSLLLLLGAVGFLLLIACTNVANLQLARGAGRSRELAVRLALGAGRGRLGRQLLTESLVLALAGGALGVGLAYGLVQITIALLPENYVPNEARITLNAWVLLFTTAISMLSGIIAGLVPAWQCTRPDVNEALKDGGQGAGQHRGNRTRSALAVAQVTLSLVLLVGASLMTLGFMRAMETGQGFNTDRMLLLNVPLSPKRYTTYAQRIGFSRDFLERMRALPGVTHASVGLPPGVGPRSGVTIPGQPKHPDNVPISFVDADYLATYGLVLKAGRYFTPQEIERGERVALISESAARLWTDDQSPIGRVVSVDALVGGGGENLPAPGAAKEVTVIGILRDVRTLGSREPAPTVITVPYTLRAPTGRPFVLRTAIEPYALLNTVRAVLRSMDKEQPMLRPLTFEEIIERDARQPRFNMTLFTVFAGIALLLAATGIYSVLSYAVAQRSREIGVRMALGAEPSNIRRLFLYRGAVIIGVGMLLGLALRATLTRVVQNQLGNVSWLEPLPFLAAVCSLGTLGFLACLIPARRATKVDPIVALRAE